MTLCGLCRFIDLDLAASTKGETWDEFFEGAEIPRQLAITHYCFYDLEVSARAGCPLCNAAVHAIERKGILKEDARRERLFRLFSPLTPRSYDTLSWITYPKCETVGSLTVFTLDDDPLSDVIPARPLAEDMSSQADLPLAKKWIKQCTQHHQMCHRSIDLVKTTLPARFLEVITNDGTRCLRLVSKLRETKWVALSYCWGHGPTLITTKSNINQHMQNIDESILPQTLKDAVVLTRTLGFSYLWIDALCIVQDSEEDWNSESAKMKTVYALAELTFSAESSPASDSGFFDTISRERSKFQAYTAIVPAESKDLSLKGQLHFRLQFSAVTFLPRPIRDRAWVMQEALMSRRLLRWTNEQIFWQCGELEASEAFPTGIKSKDRKAHSCSHDISTDFNAFRWSDETFSEAKALDLWYKLVDHYCMKQLTKPQDRLVAISAISSAIASKYGFWYIAGVWRHDFVRGLAWQVMNAGCIRVVQETAPSWSWASIGRDPSAMEDESQHPTYIYAAGLEPYLKWQRVDPDLEVRLVAENLTMANADPFSKFLSGTITIRGLTHSVCRCAIATHCFDVRQQPEDVERLRVGISPVYKDADGAYFSYDLGACSSTTDCLHGPLLLLRLMRVAMDNDKDGHSVVVPYEQEISESDMVITLVLAEETGLIESYSRVGRIVLPRHHPVLGTRWEWRDLILC